MRMFKQSALFLMLLLSGNLFGQTYPVHCNVKVLKDADGFSSGEKVNIVSYVHESFLPSDKKKTIVHLYYFEDAEKRKLYLDDIDEKFQVVASPVQGLWDYYIITDLLPVIKKKGHQPVVRKEMQEDALRYIHELESGNVQFSDPYLEDYINGLIFRISPKNYFDGRKMTFNAFIVQDPSMEARLYPNGTFLITTGLLASLQNEDELVAVLSNQIAHMVLDHEVQNVNKAIVRQNRATFWAGLATGLTAVGEGLAAKNGYYLPGMATTGMLMATEAIASKVIDRLGMKYTDEQVQLADQISMQVLESMGYQPGALSSVLTRLQSGYEEMGESPSYLSLDKRIAKCVPVYSREDRTFRQMVSFAISNVASFTYFDRDYQFCSELLSQNMKNEVATSEDFSLKADCLLKLGNTPELNHQIMDLVNKAKELDSFNLQAYKIEIILSLRMNQNLKAMDLLQNYLVKLADVDSGSTYSYQYVANEQSWAKRMLTKLNGMNLLH